LFPAQAIRGFAILLCIVPSVGMALNGRTPDELRYASGLFNLMRNLGGAIGIATVTTWLQDYGRIHGELLSEAIPHNGTAALAQAASRIAAFTSDAVHAQQVIAGELTQLVAQQALTLAFSDVFTLMAAMFVMALAIVPFCKVPPLTDAQPAVGAH
jgi:DHA2 family multidrug resistance protein